VLVAGAPALRQAAETTDVPGRDEEVAVEGLRGDGRVEGDGEGLEIAAGVGGRGAERVELDRQRVNHVASASWASISANPEATRVPPPAHRRRWVRGAHEDERVAGTRDP